MKYEIHQEKKGPREHQTKVLSEDDVTIMAKENYEFLQTDIEKMKKMILGNLNEKKKRVRLREKHMKCVCDELKKNPFNILLAENKKGWEYGINKKNDRVMMQNKNIKNDITEFKNQIKVLEQDFENSKKKLKTPIIEFLRTKKKLKTDDIPKLKEEIEKMFGDKITVTHEKKVGGSHNDKLNIAYHTSQQNFVNSIDIAKDHEDKGIAWVHPASIKNIIDSLDHVQEINGNTNALTEETKNLEITAETVKLLKTNLRKLQEEYFQEGIEYASFCQGELATEVYKEKIKKICRMIDSPSAAELQVKQFEDKVNEYTSILQLFKEGHAKWKKFTGLKIGTYDIKSQAEAYQTNKELGFDMDIIREKYEVYSEKFKDLIYAKKHKKK